MIELVRRALLYRKSATAAVMLHVESDLHEHANGAVRDAHLAPHSRACDNTAYISNDLMNMLAIFCIIA